MAAVTPIMRLLVAMAGRSGTRMSSAHHGHLDGAAAHPEQPRDVAGHEAQRQAGGQVVDAVGDRASGIRVSERAGQRRARGRRQRFGRLALHADEHVDRTAAKMPKMARPLTRMAVAPPTRAPSVVATSSVMPSRLLVRPRATSTSCEADEVTTTPTRLVPTAFLTGTPRNSVRIGTIRMPPPTPSRLPACRRPRRRRAGVFGILMPDLFFCFFLSFFLLYYDSSIFMNVVY